MVGGIVLETILLPDKVWVNTVEAGENQSGKCAVYCGRTHESEQVRPGDSFWWQGKFCYWTPINSPRKKQHVDFDIMIPKVGFSGVSRPKSHEPNQTT